MIPLFKRIIVPSLGLLTGVIAGLLFGYRAPEAQLISQNKIDYEEGIEQMLMQFPDERWADFVEYSPADANFKPVVLLLANPESLRSSFGKSFIQANFSQNCNLYRIETIRARIHT